MTEPTPITRLPNAGDPNLPARDDRDWVLSTELIDEAGITYRQLDYWCRTGFLTPREDIDHDQVDRARTTRLLLAAGISLVTIREHIDEVLDTGEAHVGAVTITIHHPSGDTAA